MPCLFRQNYESPSEMLEHDRTHVENAAALSHNALIPLTKCFFRPVPGVEILPVDVPSSGDCTFYINTMVNPITVMDRDGMLRVIKPDRPSATNVIPPTDLRALHPNTLIIIKTTTHDLSVFNQEIDRTNDPTPAIEEVETLKDMQRSFSDFSGCFTSVYRAFVKALHSQQLLGRDKPNQVGMTSIENNGRFVVGIFAVIKEEDIALQGGSYVESADIVIRKEVYEQDPNRTHQRLVKNLRGLIHPFSLFGTAYNAEGGHSARDPNIYFRMVRVIRREKNTGDKYMYVVSFNSVSRVVIQKPLHGEDDGVYVTEKDEHGVLRETRYDFVEAKTIGIFEYLAEATSEHQQVASKYISDQAAAMAHEREREQKERDRKEAERKNEAQRKSDVVRYVTQVLGALAALVTTAVTMIKIFAPRNFGFA